MPALLLASSSPYRRELLERLQLPFTWQSPSIDEGRREGEAAIALVKRLAEEKARALAASHPEHLIIGSDQVAVLSDGQILGKPHDQDFMLLVHPTLATTQQEWRGLRVFG